MILSCGQSLIAPVGALCILACVVLSAATVNAEDSAVFTAGDIVAEHEVYSPVLSPDGAWVAYITRVNELDRDARNADLWMASLDGRRNIRLTRSAASESRPGWSPDGRYLSFLAPGGSRDESGKEASPPRQIWLLDRTGGEPEQLTAFEGDVADYAWSPDGRRLAVVAWDRDSRKTASDDATPPPIVIDRYYFKEDYTGYLGEERKRLYLFDVATRKAERLTDSRWDETLPSWSPDGTRIAFYGREGDDPDRHTRFVLLSVEPRPGATPKRIATLTGDIGEAYWMSPPRWSPDGRRLLFTGGGDPSLIYYAGIRSFVVDAAGGSARPLGASLDRNTSSPRWAPDGASVLLLLEDDRNLHLARVGLDDDRIERLLPGRRETSAFDIAPSGEMVVLDSTVDKPPEVYVLGASDLRPLSRQNDAWLAGKRLASVEEAQFTSRDGTVIHGFIVKPPGFREGRKYPTILRIHGGPVMQYANAFMGEWQALAGAGYVVVAANPRGSSGRGEDFAKAIYADWGNKDGEDVLAAVDHAVAEGIADPKRLGVGGWSYGGILTNQVIARDGRFKVAVSGAGIGNALAGYGTDMYIREYETELGLPWEKPEVYQRVSYPFLHADRIQTPTLFLCGEKDFNVPLLNSEQMYQALKSRKVPTQLVIYPGQYHGIETPSYQVDRMQRYVDWYGRYLR